MQSTFLAIDRFVPPNLHGAPKRLRLGKGPRFPLWRPRAWRRRTFYWLPDERKTLIAEPCAGIAYPPTAGPSGTRGERREATHADCSGRKARVLFPRRFDPGHAPARGAGTARK